MLFLADGGGLLNDPVALTLLIVGIIVVFAAVFLYFFVFRKKINAKIAKSKAGKAQKQQKQASEENLAANVFNKRKEDDDRAHDSDEQMQNASRNEFINRSNFGAGSTTAATHSSSHVGKGYLETKEEKEKPVQKNKQTAKDIKADESVAESFNFSSQFISKTMASTADKEKQDDGKKKPAKKASSASSAKKTK